MEPSALLRIAFALIVAGLHVDVFAGNSAGDPPGVVNLFKASPLSLAEPSDSPLLAFRQRLLRSRLHLMAADLPEESLHPGQKLRLDLPPDTKVVLSILRVDIATDGAKVIACTTAGSDEVAATLSFAPEGIAGVADIPGKGRFEIVPEGQGRHVVRRLTSGPHEFCGTGLHATPRDGLPPLHNAEPGSAEGIPALASVGGVPESITEMDVLFVYSTNAVAGAGGEAILRQAILDSVDGANFRFTNSQVRVRLNPIYMGTLAAGESGDIETDINNLLTDAQVIALRTLYKADLVVQISESDISGLGGIADLPPAGGDPNRHISVLVRTALGRDVRVLAHEVGHLLGANHDREHALDVSGNPLSGAFPYSFGHRFMANGVTYRTVMSYEPGNNVPYFSNPALSFDGVPLGVAAGKPGAADNARTMNQLAPIVAKYQTALSRIEFVSRQYEVDEDGGSVTVELRRSGDLNTATSARLRIDVRSTAATRLDFSPAGVTNEVAFATNQVTARITIPILQDDLVEGDEEIRLAFSFIRGPHGAGVEGRAVVVIHDDETSFRFGSPSFVVSEAAGFIDVPVSWIGGFGTSPSTEVTIRVGDTGDLATPGLDFEGGEVKLAFTASARDQTLRIRIPDDVEPEADESFTITAGNARATVRIIDDERDGSLVSSYGLALDPDGIVFTGAALADGRVLIAGAFGRLEGVPRTALARLQRDGSVDTGFHTPEILSSLVQVPGIEGPNINRILVQRDGKIVIAGRFAYVAGKFRSGITRLEPNGLPDQSFRPGLGVNGTVYGLGIDTENRILIGGIFTEVDSNPRTSLARLNSDGTLDSSFTTTNLVDGVVGSINSIAIQSDRRILIAGSFDKVHGKKSPNLARLNSDGTLDPSFALGGAPSERVRCVEVLADGRILVGGFFGTIGGRGIRRLARLNSDGSVDLSFKPTPPLSGPVETMAALPDGRIVVGGRLNASGEAMLAVLRSDGTADTSVQFGTRASDFLRQVLLHADGSLYALGAFRHFNGLSAPGIARTRIAGVQPAFTEVDFDSPGRLRATIAGLPGGDYSLEGSSDLELWKPLQRVMVDQQPVRVELNVDLSTPRQYYRLRSP